MGVARHRTVMRHALLAVAQLVLVDVLGTSAAGFAVSALKSNRLQIAFWVGLWVVLPTLCDQPPHAALNGSLPPAAQW